MPYEEIVSAPLEVYVAPVGTAFPATPATAPAVAWKKLGVNGNKDQTEDGLTIGRSQDVETIYGAGSTRALKKSRNRDDTVITFSLMDTTLETITQIIRGVDDPTTYVTDTAAGAGTVGYRSASLDRDENVNEVAVLVRGKASAYGPDFDAQFEIARAAFDGDQSMTYRKGPPASIGVQLTALDNPSGTAVRLVMQDAVAI